MLSLRWAATERQLKDLDSQQVRIKYVYGSVHATTGRRVRNDYNPQEADDVEATAAGSAHVGNDFKLYQIN